MLTVKQIEAATFGKSPVRLHDGQGLYLRLNKGGRKTFQLRMTESGRTRWITLGCFPDMSLRDARVQAILKREELLNPDVDRPMNVTEHMPDLPAPDAIAPLFRDFAKIWFERKKKELSNGKHIQQNWNTLKMYVFPQLGKLRLDQIKQRHVIAVFDPIWRLKHETAKRTLGRVKEVFELAKIMEHVEVNPADFDPKIAFGRVGKQTQHQPSLEWERAPDLWQWLHTHPAEEDVRQMMMVMILTGKRTKEVRFVGWDDLDLEHRIWSSKREHMKQRRQHRTPISDQLAVVFENMKLLNGEHANVFARPKNKLKVICENRARIEFQKFDPGMTGHGLRTTFRTWARKQGCYAHDVMETALSHEKDQLVQAYMRDDLLEERRPMMQAWADYVTCGALPTRLVDRL